MNASGGPGEPVEPAQAAPANTGAAHTGAAHTGAAHTGAAHTGAGHTGPRSPYEPPTVTYLGTLRELTLGGVSGPDDGVGGAGGIGSL